MNFQQLRIVQEAVRRNFNLTEVANALFTSQSGVSKNILDLEDELGVALFQRRGKRLVGLTPPGRELLVVVERILLDARNVKNIAEQFANRDEGKLTIATTHTQARYVLPPVIRRFRDAFPKVQLQIHESGPAEIVARLQAGEADVGIATEALEASPAVASFVYYVWHHAVVVPVGHPLAGVAKPTLEAIAAHPLVTYHPGFTGRARIDAAFAAAGLAPEVAMSAVDADVIKTYVELGLGVGIVASMAFDESRDRGLVKLDASHLFPLNTTRIAVRRGHVLRGFALRFLSECAPSLTPEVVRRALDGE